MTILRRVLRATIRTVVSVCVSWALLGGAANGEGSERSRAGESLGEPLDWDVLPNGLLVLSDDRSGDGIPDYVELHQITWSGWTAQTVQEIEKQA